MQKYKENLLEIFILCVLFIFLAAVSYYHVDTSISVIKYHLDWGIRNLLDNYSLYHQSFQTFLYKTSAFHTGNSGAEWITIFYLLPLFIFCDLLGGLSLKAVCLFTVTTSLIFVGLFYWWVRGVWGKQAAFFAVFFLGFSSIFQEFARSGSYDAYSLLIAMIWILFIFRYDQQEGTINYFLFGLLTALTWYGHGTLRCLTLVAIVHILSSKVTRKAWVMGVFLTGMMVILIPGFFIKVAIENIDLAHYHHPLYKLFFDREASFWGGSVDSFIKEVWTNLKNFGFRMLGSKQLIEPVLTDRTHASLWNPCLVVPLCIGIWRTFKLKQQSSNRLLFLLALMIYLAPCLLTSSLGYADARRSLLYVIPSYCFIGLGMKQILDWIGNARNYYLKRGTIFVIVSVMVVILATEVRFVEHYVLSSKRDVGFLDFIDKIKQTGFSGKMYYIDGRTIYRWTLESDIMRAALMENGKSPFDVSSGPLNIPAPQIPQDFYVAAGSFISQKEFDDWCARNKLEARVILESPVVNGYSGIGDKYFRFYIVHRTT